MNKNLYTSKSLKDSKGRSLTHTATSCQNIANFSIEQAGGLSPQNENVNLYDDSRDLVGTNSTSKLVKKGYTSEQLIALKQINAYICDLHALNSYLRPAVKNLINYIDNLKDLTKQEWLDSISRPAVTYPSLPNFNNWLKKENIELPIPKALSIAEYCEKFNITPPEEPERKTWTFEDILNELPIDKYAEYNSLNAKSAQMGEIIHPTGPFNKARKKFYKILSNPNELKENMICSYTPTVSIENVENVFSYFQGQQREYNRQFNSLKKKYKDELDRRNEQERQDYQTKWDAYSRQMLQLKNSVIEYNKSQNQAYQDKYNELSVRHSEYLEQLQLDYKNALQSENNDFEVYKAEELAKAYKLKIIIPQEHIDLFYKLSGILGQTE